MSSTAAQAITHTGATGFDFSLVSTNGNVAISSTNGDVSIESMTIDGGDVTGVATIYISGAATVGNLVADTGNVLLMSSTAAHAIAHTGATGFDFSLVSTNNNVAISSTNGDVSIESMTIDGGDVTCVATIDVSGTATVGNLVANTGNVELAAGNVDVAKAKGNC